MIFFVEEKFSWLPSKNKVADEKTEHQNILSQLGKIHIEQWTQVKY